MVYFLRDENGDTLIEVECWVKDEEGYLHCEVSPSVYIENYSKTLLSFDDENKQSEFIEIFETLSELRGWMWESYFMVKKNTPDEIDGLKVALRGILSDVSDRFNLYLVED